MLKIKKHGVNASSPLKSIDRPNSATLFITLCVLLYPSQSGCAYKVPEADKPSKTTEQTTPAGKEKKPEGVSPLKKRPAYAEGELLVQFKEDAGESDIEKVNASFKAKVIRTFRKRNLFLIKLPENLPVTDAVEKYKRMTNVEYAEPNYIYAIRTDREK